ncbi:MAG: acyltransferase, partial [Candidatus Micrarchaeota archaeon]|nr:acyltransferase [Candidatus Micrarchaeota archaeon]
MKVPNTTKRAAPKNKTGFNPALSGLRGLASFLVAIYHYAPFLLAGIPILLPLTSTFFIGVMVFLMLSMYLLLNRLDANSDLKHYFKRRIVRIWPIYYSVVILTFLYFNYKFKTFLLSLFFLNYFVNPSALLPTPIVMFWTLQIEEFMYLLIPLIHKLPKTGKFWLGFGMVVAGSILSLLMAPIWWVPYLYSDVIVAYGIGLLVYCINIPKKMRYLFLIGIIGMVLTQLVVSPHATTPIEGLRLPPSLYFVYYVYQIFFLLVILGSGAILANPPNILGKLTVLGEESYALYAVHVAFLDAFGGIGFIIS